MSGLVIVKNPAAYYRILKQAGQSIKDRAKSTFRQLNQPLVLQEQSQRHELLIDPKTGMRKELDFYVMDEYGDPLVLYSTF